MTRALQDAFDAASKLPDKDQEALAAAIFQELAADERWESAVGAAPGALEKLADEALAEHRAGRSAAAARTPGRSPSTFRYAAECLARLPVARRDLGCFATSSRAFG